MKITLSVPFGYEPNYEIRKILEDFRDMVNFCIEVASKHNTTSYYKLRKLTYDEWKSRWNYSTHYCHSACRVATSMLKSFRRLKRKGLAKDDKPVAKKLFIQLDPLLVKYEGDKLRISVKPRRFIYIHLKYGEYQKKFIEEWKAGKLRVGEVSINENKVLVPFRKDVDLSNPNDWIAIDVNETNVTAVSSNPHVLRVKSNLRTIHTTYFNIVRRIQRLSKYKPKTARRLLKKYSGRRKRRAMDECHKIAKKIVEFAKQHNLGIIMEDLKGIRMQINYGKMLNRRLHSWNFRRLQFYIEYRAKLNGLPVIYVDPKHTSSLCPICGKRLNKAPNGHRLLKCETCSYENDRDIIACLNMLRMRGAPLPLKALNEASNNRGEREGIKIYESHNGKTNSCIVDGGNTCINHL